MPTRDGLSAFAMCNGNGLSTITHSALPEDENRVIFQPNRNWPHHVLKEERLLSGRLGLASSLYPRLKGD